MKHLFNTFAKKIAEWTGSVWASIVALLLVVGWFLGGIFIYGFGSGSQLFINSVTTIITFVMVFLIQNTQNRESKAVQLKLNELIFSKQHASNEMLNVEQLTDEELEELHQRYSTIAEECRRRSGLE